MTCAWAAAGARGRRTIDIIIYDAASGTASANIPYPPPSPRTVRPRGGCEIAELRFFVTLRLSVCDLRRFCVCKFRPASCGLREADDGSLLILLEGNSAWPALKVWARDAMHPTSACRTLWSLLDGFVVQPPRPHFRLFPCATLPTCRWPAWLKAPRFSLREGCAYCARLARNDSFTKRAGPPRKRSLPRSPWRPSAVGGVPASAQ